MARFAEVPLATGDQFPPTRTWRPPFRQQRRDEPIVNDQRLQRLTAVAAFGAGAAGTITAIGAAVIFAEAQMARRAIGTPFGLQGPQSSGTYHPQRTGALDATPLRLAVIGDSAAVGLGVDDPRQTPGAVIARALADLLGHKDLKTTMKYTVSSGASKARKMAEIDKILDKIKTSGYESLSTEEKKRLFEQGKKS